MKKTCNMKPMANNKIFHLHTSTKFVLFTMSVCLHAYTESLIFTSCYSQIRRFKAKGIHLLRYAITLITKKILMSFKVKIKCISKSYMH